MKILASDFVNQAAMIIVAAVTAVLLSANAARALPIFWSLSEFQPNVPNGGRANSIAVNPANNNDIFVASETGGLFHSTDRGVTWHHVDSFTPFVMGAVAYVPGLPNVLIATAADGYTSGNDGGGIWRSTDDGTTWTHIANPTLPAGSPRFSASEISIAPDTGNIYVATSVGVSRSSDRGVTWTNTSPFDGYAAVSVVAQSGNLVLAGNYSGIARSTDAGATWTRVAGAPPIYDMHGLARSPLVANTLYAVSMRYTPPIPPATGGTLTMQLHVTEDSGLTWSAIPNTTTGGGGCGGIGFVKPVASTFRRIRPPYIVTTYTLWYGDRCGLARLTATPIPGTTRYNYTGTWTQSVLAHADTRDIAFTSGGLGLLSAPAPMLVANDGGLLSTSDAGATWTYTGGGVKGFNALQITEVKGQIIDSPSHYDLYYGTQDNDLRATRDFNVMWSPSICCEGFFIEMQKRVATEADSQITFTLCGPCSRLLTGAQFSSPQAWNDPPGVAGDVAIVSKSLHVQGVNDRGGFSKGLAVTQDLSATWSQYAVFPEDLRDIPKLSRSWYQVFGGPRRYSSVQYQAIRTGFDPVRGADVIHLVRLTKRRFSATAGVYYPAMNGFGSLGINPTMFAWYAVFAVDPSDSSHLIAPDIFNKKIMETHDGGDNWSEIPSLTTAVLDSGRFNFNNGIFPHASAVSFNPHNGNTAAIATHANGLFVSSDAGATWEKVGASERATYITSVEWRTNFDAFISTYGRGLWRLTGRIFIPEIPRLCAIVNCLIRYIERGDPPPNYDRGIIVFDGAILGARTRRGVLRQIFVSPGSTIGFTSKDKTLPQIEVTETRKAVRFEGLPHINLGKNERDIKKFVLPKKSRRPLILGYALDANGAVVGAAYGAKAIPLSAVDSKPAEGPELSERDEGVAKSPTAGKPYVTLRSGRSDQVGPGELMTVEIVRVPPGTALEFLLDETAVAKGEADRNGIVRVEILAPSTFGVHTISVRDIKSKNIIDGMMFIVRHMDTPSERDQKRERPRHN